MTLKSKLIKLALLIAVLTVTTLQGCLQNQYFDTSTSQCVNCRTNCAQCSNSWTNCTVCLTGYYLDNTACIACPLSCASCNSSSICTSCKQNYYMKNNTCLSCGKNCMFCNSSSCNTCQTGYDIKSDCLSCGTQFFYNTSTNGCDICPRGCLDCADKTYCFKCDKNFVFINNMCQFTDTNQGSSGQNQNPNTQSSNKSIFFIILGVLVGFIVISFIVCTGYYCLRKKVRKIKRQGDSKNLKVSNKVSNTILKIDKDSIIEPQNQLCLICKLVEAEIASSCGHFFHNKCYQMQEKRCPVCPQDFSVAETFFQQSKNNEIQLESEYSGARQKDDEVNSKDHQKNIEEIGSLQ